MTVPVYVIDTKEIVKVVLDQIGNTKYCHRAEHISI